VICPSGRMGGLTLRLYRRFVHGGEFGSEEGEVGHALGLPSGRNGHGAYFEMHARHLEPVSFFRSSLIRDCQPSPWAR
jgi:hypothetical protein